MKHDPKILINRTKNKVEFMCGGILYIFEAGEKKLVEGIVADHALNFVNTGLEEYTPEVEEQEEVRAGEVMPDFRGLKFQKLVSLARKDFQVGMNKDDLVKLLEGKWLEKHPQATS